MKKRSKFYWSDFIHLLPLVLFIVDYMPFFLFSAAEKQEIIKETMRQKGTYSFSEGWLFLDSVHAVSRVVIAIGYAIAQLKIILEVPKFSGDSIDSRSIFSWFLSLTILEIIFAISGFVIIVFFPGVVQRLLSETVTVTFIIVLLLLRFKPGILYGMRHDNIESLNSVDTSRLVHPLPEELTAELDERLKVFIREKTYLKHDITLAELAERVKTRPYILSAFLNRKYEIHFNGLINKLRIEYITEGLANGEWGMLTLEAIGEQAGFNNRTTFFNAFKKFTGMTPTQYIKQMKDGNNKSVAISSDDN